VTMPAADAQQLGSPGADLWPDDASIQSTDRDEVLDLMTEPDEIWRLPEWAPGQFAEGSGGIVVFGGDGGREWQVVFLSDDPVFGDAQVLLDCRR